MRNAYQEILIIAAHPREIKDLKNKSLDPHVKLRTCDDSKQARRTCKRLNRGGQVKELITNLLRNETRPPSLILNIGFAGALSETLSLGETVLSNEFLKFEDSTCHRLKIDQPQVEEIETSIKLLSRECSQGTILTVDKPVTDLSKRDELFEATGASVVDMESYHLAEGTIEQALCFGKASIPFLSLKIISDQADEDTEKMVKSKGDELSSKLADYTCNLLKVL